MDIRTKRVYDPPAENDGYRVLVDRIWPRGMKRDELAIDRWMRNIAPSTELRKWFNHDLARWDAFRKRYFQELHSHADALRSLLEEVGDGPLTLVYAARDQQHNNATALREYLRKLRKS